MGTTTDKLSYLSETKELLRQGINNTGAGELLTSSNTFKEYVTTLEEHPYYLECFVEGIITDCKVSSVESVGFSAFRSCSSLTSASFPNATSIGNYAFDGCTSLTSASFPNTTIIGSSAFHGCTSLPSVSFPNATSIESWAFQSCSSLTSVSFPNVTSIGTYAFKSCSKLTSVDIPNATSIGDYAFQECTSLPSVSFPNVTSIGSYAFYACSSLTSVSFPNVTSMGTYAFRDCTNLTSVDIPNATSVGSNAFQNCSSLTSASFPNAISIGPYAFYNCISLTSASFPNATSIGNNAFNSCSNLTTLYIGTETDTVCNLSSTSAIPSNVTKIYVPASLVNSYKSATNWSSFADKIFAVPILMPIGGKIFYDAGNNGATYTFYDSNGSVINDTSFSGLQNAVSYTVEGTPSSDRFYAVYPSVLSSGNKVYWGFYRNADIKSSGGNIINTGEAIGTGKTATQAILNYIDTYASNETASTNRPSSDISQASPNGYNLYKNCGTSYKYLWDVLRDANDSSLEGHNDWFIPSKDEMKQIGSSKVISDITRSNYIWSSSAYSSSANAWYWSYNRNNLSNGYRAENRSCVVCRAF